MSEPRSPCVSRRLIGTVTAPTPGPTLIAIGSLHGNEPAGVDALQRVFARISGHPNLLSSGSFTALVGNMAALSAQRRFMDRDLNRNWNGQRGISHAREPGSTTEDLEHSELLGFIEQEIGQARDGVYVLDLHTTSGDSVPFTVFADTLASRGFARRLPNPIILGLEEHLEGTMVDYLSGRGHAAAAVEGGQHQDPASIDRLEAIMWIALDVLGIATDQPSITRGRRALSRVTRRIPHALEIRAAHKIVAGDRFRMHPGFRGFDRVRGGEILAADASGEIHAPTDGFLLMPLYQELGDDGFFIVKPVWRVWLLLSRILRTLRADRIVHWLPGVSRHGSERGVYWVNRRIARYFALEVLHLLGFKKVRDGDELVVRRRMTDQA